AEDAAFEEDEAVCRIVVPNRSYEIACAITNNWRPVAAERGEDQVGKFAIGGPLASFDGDKLGDELGFVDMKAAAIGIGESPGANFGRAGMVDHVGMPSGFDPVAKGRDTAARLAGDNDFLHCGFGEIDVMLMGDFGKPQGVSRRAKEGRRAIAAQEL